MSIAGQVFSRQDSKFVKKVNIQEFEGFFFKIQLESFPEQKNDIAKLSFFNYDNKEISIPDKVICKDNTNDIIPAISRTNFYLIFNNQKGFKICAHLRMCAPHVIY